MTISASSIFKISQLDLPAPLVVIVGPTAVGKTETALQLAERLGGEIVSADSRLFYRGMDIGTAKPNAQEMARVPHHLVDVADPDETWSLSVFQQAATQAIQSIYERGRLPFLVGGTGQYIHAVVQGWSIPPQEPDFSLRAALERWSLEVGAEGLYQRLSILDPQAAALIDVRNMRRTIRALEVTLRTGRRFSDQRQRLVSPYSLLLVGLRRSREELYLRVDERIDGMFSSGFIGEVQALLDKGFAPDLPTLSAIGYREVIAYLQGKMTLEDAKTQMKRLTRRFVRHQGSWFSEKDLGIHWLEPGLAAVDQVEKWIRSATGWIPRGSAEVFSKE